MGSLKPEPSQEVVQAIIDNNLLGTDPLLGEQLKFEMVAHKFLQIPRISLTKKSSLGKVEMIEQTTNRDVQPGEELCSDYVEVYTKAGFANRIQEWMRK